METRSIGNWEEYLEKSQHAFKEKYDMKRVSLLTISDFTVIRTVGMGAYGRVVLARHTDYGKHYAIKILEKARVILLDQLQHTLDEKRILQSINFQFIVWMEHFFQDNVYLYFVMPFVVGGEMFVVLRKLRSFTEDTAAFYAAQVVLALEYLHFLRVVYRDLKPENILICADGYIKLTDLGFAKKIKSRTYTLCGTIEYLAPEVVILAGHGFPVDWWALGVLIYEMCVGKSPFFSLDQMSTFESIAEGRYDTELLASRHTQDLVRALLTVKPSKRLGSSGNGVSDIKAHPWFSKIDWMAVLNKQATPYIQPHLSGIHDASMYGNFEEEHLEHCEEDIFKGLFSEF